MHSENSQPSRLPQSERLARMRLARSRNIGPITFRRLIERFGTAKNAVEILPDLIPHTNSLRRIEIASRDAVVAEIDAARKIGARPIIIGDPEYPPLLAQIDDAPPFFYVIGRVELLLRPAIAIVGARNASANGRNFARRLANTLSDAGYVVVSGMARGIDGAVHDGCLPASPRIVPGSQPPVAVAGAGAGGRAEGIGGIADIGSSIGGSGIGGAGSTGSIGSAGGAGAAGNNGGGGGGGTIAVLGGGVDVVYPREHRALYERICAEGCVISEMPPGLVPQARHFPRRNRIISGLSYGVIVVEAGRNSGSLITARFAAEQGRDVFAVPGNPADPRAGGPNSLLREGAILCDSADVVIDALRTAERQSALAESRQIFNFSARPAPTTPPRHDDRIWQMIAQSIAQDGKWQSGETGSGVHENGDVDVDIDVDVDVNGDAIGGAAGNTVGGAAGNAVGNGGDDDMDAPENGHGHMSDAINNTDGGNIGGNVPGRRKAGRTRADESPLGPDDAGAITPQHQGASDAHKGVEAQEDDILPDAEKIGSEKIGAKFVAGSKPHATDDAKDHAKSGDRAGRKRAMIGREHDAHTPQSGQETAVADMIAAPMRILEFLSVTPVGIDQLGRLAGLPADVISTILIELELSGRVERHPGNRVSRIAE